MKTIRRLLGILLVLLALAAPAFAQTIPSSTFAGLPVSAAAGTLRWVTDGACTPIPGTAEIGGGVNMDLVSYDATQSRWEFISRAPLGTTETDLPTFLSGSRISYDHTTSGAASDDVQGALDELFAGGGGGGGGGATNLSKVATSTQVTVSSDTGTDVVLIGASQSLAGLMTAADKIGFDLASATVKYANPATPGTTTAGIAEAVASCGSGISGAGGAISQGCVVQLACDTNASGRTITSTLVVGGNTLATAKSGVLLNGCGPGYQNQAGQQTAATTLVWGGAAGANMIEFRTCNHCGIANATLDAEAIGAHALYYDSVVGWPTSNHRAFNLQIQGTTAEAIYIDDSSQVDNGQWDHISVRDSASCFKQTYSQSVNNETSHFECAIAGSTLFEVADGELKIRDSYFGLNQPNSTAVKVGPSAMLDSTGATIEYKSTGGHGFVADASGAAGGSGDVSRIVGTRFILISAGGSAPGHACVEWNKQGHLSFLDNAVIGINSGADQGCDLLADNSADADKLYVRSEGNSHRNVYVAGEFPNGVIDYGVVPWVKTSKVVITQTTNLGVVNPGGVNHSSGLVDWTQLKGVPAGFADGSDDGASGGATDLNGLTDVTLAAPPVGATLVWNGSQWVNGPLDLADSDARTGVLPDANVADGITASNYMPLGGGQFTGNVTLGSTVQLTAGFNSIIGPAAGGIVQASQFLGSGSTSSAVDLATAEVGGLLGMGNGGLGAASMTSGGVLLGTGSLAVHATPVLTAGQLLIGDGSGDPTIAAPSGDIAMTSAGVVSFNSNTVDANELVSTGVSAGTYQNATVTVDVDGRVTAISAGSNVLIASGTKALSTSSIASGACATDTITATGVAAGDIVDWSPTSDLSAVVGFRPISGDGLAIYPPLAASNSISVKTCNPTGSAIVPGAVSIAWRVAR